MDLFAVLFVLSCVAGIHGGIQIIRRKEYTMTSRTWAGVKKRKCTGSSAVVLGWLQLLSASFMLSGVVAVYLARDSPLVWILFGIGMLIIFVGAFVADIIRRSTPLTNE